MPTCTHQLPTGGHNIRWTAAGLGLPWNTVPRFARASSREELLVSDGTGRRASIVEEHAP